MKKSAPAATPDDYVNSLSGWQRLHGARLRQVVMSAGEELVETVKWGHLVFLYNGPVLFIRAEEHRVLFGFWRGKNLRQLEPKLIASGKYDMATMILDEGTALNPEIVAQLVLEAIGLNKVLGNPTVLAPRRKPMQASF